MSNSENHTAYSIRRIARFALCSFLFLVAYISKPSLAMSQTPQAVIVAQEAKRGPAENFTGVVWVKTLVPANDQTDCIVSEVTFEPKARTTWHTHPNGQILVVIQGTGYYQEKGQPMQIIKQGESVNISPNVVHWHGAGPNGQFTHIAINPNVSKGGAVTWLQAVTDQEYSQK